MYKGTAVTEWLRFWATNRKVASSMQQQTHTITPADRMWGKAGKLDLDEKDHRKDAKNIPDTNTTRMVSTPAI